MKNFKSISKNLTKKKYINFLKIKIKLKLTKLKDQLNFFEKKNRVIKSCNLDNFYKFLVKTFV